MFDINKPVRTNSGNPARIIATNALGCYPLVALVLRNGVEVPESFTLDGLFHTTGVPHDSENLVNVPEPKKVFKVRRWFIVFEDGSTQTSFVAPDRDYRTNVAAIKYVEIEVTEGEGL